MKNDKLLIFMEVKGISRTQLSKSTGIPASTLGRIINGDVQKIKAVYMDAIANALDTSIHTIFDVPFDNPFQSIVTPNEAGASVKKLLLPDESMLLYWYQNSFREGKAAILKSAKAQYLQAQIDINRKANNPSIINATEDDEAAPLSPTPEIRFDAMPHTT